MDIFSLMLLVLLIGCGIYCIATWLRLRKEWRLFDNKIMLPGNCSVKDCVNEDGFLEYMAPKMLIFGISLVVLGLLYLPGILYDSGLDLGLPKLALRILDIALPVLSITDFIWFIVAQRKASKLFW